jgi:CDP-6-deoxy-D-xylo-4-hexulose-3-dehydrase
LRSWGRSSSLFDEKSEKIENRFNIKLDGILYDKKFVFETIGHNLEPSELGAAFGLVQLKKLKANLRKREINFNLHTKYLKNILNISFCQNNYLNQDQVGWHIQLLLQKMLLFLEQKCKYF